MLGRVSLALCPLEKRFQTENESWQPCYANTGHRAGSPVSIWGTFGLPQAIPGLARTPARAPLLRTLKFLNFHPNNFTFGIIGLNNLKYRKGNVHVIVYHSIAYIT